MVSHALQFNATRATTQHFAFHTHNIHWILARSGDESSTVMDVVFVIPLLIHTLCLVYIWNFSRCCCRRSVSVFFCSQLSQFVRSISSDNDGRSVFFFLLISVLPLVSCEYGRLQLFIICHFEYSNKNDVISKSTWYTRREKKHNSSGNDAAATATWISYQQFNIHANLNVSRTEHSIALRKNISSTSFSVGRFGRSVYFS